MIPVCHRIELEILFIAYKALHAQASSYIEELIEPYHHPWALCSEDVGLLLTRKVSKIRMEVKVSAFWLLYFETISQV